jgi:hypothetical protein
MLQIYSHKKSKKYFVQVMADKQVWFGQQKYSVPTATHITAIFAQKEITKRSAERSV